MAQEQLEDQGETARPGGARFVVAGVVGALALGVGLGLWARPADSEREGLAKPAAATKPAGASGRLQIVVDDTPAPIGAPLEVLPAGVAAAAATGQPQIAAPQPEPVMPMAPRRAPAGLMKVDAPMPPALAAIGPAPAPEPEAPRAEKPKTAKAKDAPKPEAARKAEKKKAEGPARKSQPKRAEAAPKRVKAEPAKKQATKAGKTPTKAKAKAEARAEKADKRAQPTKKKAEPKLAKADKPKAADKAKAPSRLSKLVGAVKSAPKKLKSETKTAKAKAPSKVARAEPKKKVVKPKPADKPKPALADDGSTRVARNGACALSDPGEALVCADPRLNQRDRQLQRAYRDAEAAGVPASALRRQQERWRQARAAAARDGSWAVEDVYEARIAELNDLARDAREY